jgi:hypothetical protein
MRHTRNWWLSVGIGLLISLAALPARAALPNGVKEADIGDPTPAGSASVDANGVWTVTAGGSDIWGAADSMHFVFRTLDGNGSATMRFTTRTGGHSADNAAKSGPMMRASDDAGAVSAFIPFQGDRNMDPHYRFDADDQTTNFEVENRGHGPAANRPIWQRMERQGNRFTSLISEDGKVWTSLVSVAMENMPASVLAGIAATAHGGDVPVTVTYDNVTIGPDLSPRGVVAMGQDKGALVIWNAVPGAEGYNVYTLAADRTANRVTATPTKNTSIVLDNLENGKPATVVVAAIQGGKEGIGVETEVTPAAPVLGGLEGININTVQPGSHTVDASGVITMSGSGHVIGTVNGFSNRSDGFYFLAMPKAGNATVTVRVLDGPSAKRDDDNRQVGVMIRETLDEDSRFVMTELSSGSGTRLQRRTKASAAAEETDGDLSDPALRPVWLRLARDGNKFTASVAEDKDGKNFKPLGDPVTIDGFNSQAYVGVALSPHTGFNARPPGGLESAEAKLDNLSVK